MSTKTSTHQPFRVSISFSLWKLSFLGEGTGVPFKGNERFFKGNWSFQGRKLTLDLYDGISIEELVKTDISISTKVTFTCFYFHFILAPKEKCCIFVILFLQPGRKPASFCGRHFYACPDASYGGFVPPCGVLMHPLPGW